MLKQVRGAVIALGALALVAGACGSPAPSGATPPSGQAGTTRKLVLGFTQSQTGAQNVTSKKQTEGLQLWLDDVARSGGIKLADGTVLQPEIKFYDDESKTDRVQALYTKLINDDKVDYLVSPYSSGLVKAAAVVSEQNGKVMITAGGADDATMEQGFRNIYQVYSPGSRYLIGAIDLLGKMDPSIKKIAIINEKDAFSTSVVTAALPYAKSKGFDVVLAEGYDSGTTDFSPFLNKIAAAGPQAIIGGGHFQDGQTFAKQLYEKKIPVRFLALLVAPPEPTFAEIGDAAQYVVGPSQWEPAANYSPESAKTAGVSFFGPLSKDFITRYVAKFSAQPSYHSAGGYAAGLVLQKALEEAGTFDQAKVQLALDKMDVMTFYGRVKFSTDVKTHGKQVAHDMVYVQWQKDTAGKLATQVVWPPEAKSAEAQLRK